MPSAPGAGGLSAAAAPSAMALPSRLSASQERPLRPRELLPLLLPDLRILEIERQEAIDDRRTDDHAREPLVVRGHDVPRRLGRRRVADHVLVRLHVIVPDLPLLRVVGGELPVLLGPVEPLEKPP